MAARANPLRRRATTAAEDAHADAKFVVGVVAPAALALVVGVGELAVVLGAGVEEAGVAALVGWDEVGVFAGIGEVLVVRADGDIWTG